MIRPSAVVSHNQDPTGVFVYGTLKRGEWNHHQVAKNMTHVESATANGTLYNIWPGFPCMTDGEGEVHGELMHFDNLPKMIRQLDLLEKYEEGRPAEENRYQRCAIHVVKGNGEKELAWGYIFPKEKVIAAGGVPIIEGVWHGSRILSWLIKPVKLLQGAWHRHKAG